MEVTELIISKIVATFPDDVAQGGGDAEQLAFESSKYLPQLTEVGRKVFDGWAKLVTSTIGLGLVSPGSLPGPRL
jgi:hypothetical protein